MPLAAVAVARLAGAAAVVVPPGLPPLQRTQVPCCPAAPSSPAVVGGCPGCVLPLLAQDPGGFPPRPPRLPRCGGMGMRGPGGPGGGPAQEIKQRFDKDQDGRLDRAERDTARSG